MAAERSATDEVVFSDCTWATIPDQSPGADSIGVDELNLASGTVTWTANNTGFDIDRYAYFPRIYVTAAE